MHVLRFVVSIVYIESARTHLQHGDDDAGPFLEGLGEHAIEAVKHHGAVPALHCA